MLWKKEKYLYSSIFFLIKVNFFLFPFRITFSHSVLLFFPPAFRTSLLCHSVLAIILKHQALISLTPGHTNAINISLLCMDQYPTSIMLWTDLIPASFFTPHLTWPTNLHYSSESSADINYYILSKTKLFVGDVTKCIHSDSQLLLMEVISLLNPSCWTVISVLLM